MVVAVGVSRASLPPPPVMMLVALLFAATALPVAPSGAACGAVLHNATECHGPQIGSVAAGEVGACCSACWQIAGCGAFTFAPPGDSGGSGGSGGSDGSADCWLHPPGGQGCSLTPAETRVAGVLPARPRPGTPAAGAARLEAHAFNLSAVRLVADPGNHFAEAQALNTQFLAALEPDRILVAWRMVAGLQPFGLHGAVPYGGWMKLGPTEHTDLGHFAGHFLSATAFTVAATGDPSAQQQSGYLVAEIAKCQQAICAANASLCGYVGAVPIALLEALENHERYHGSSTDSAHVIPYYATHKIMAGLLDTYLQTDSAPALSVLLKMAEFFKMRIDTVVATKGAAWWEECLLLEFGGMNEVRRLQRCVGPLHTCSPAMCHPSTGLAVPAMPQREGV